MPDPTKMHKIIFGDGQHAGLVSKKIETRQGEEPMVAVRFRPHPRLVDKYNIHPREITQSDGTIIKEFKKKDVQQICDEPGFEAWIILENYDGSRTGIIELLDQRAIARADFFEKESIMKSEQIARLQEQLRKSVTDPTHFMDEVMAGIERTKKVVGDVTIDENTRLVPEQSNYGR